MPKPFDATLKELIEAFPADWLGLLKVPITGPVEVLSPELSAVTAAADALIRVGDSVIHIDAESGPDPALASRLLLYNVLTHRHTGLPVHSVAVLLRPNANAGGLTGELRYAVRPTGGLTFRFEILRVWETPSEELLRGGLGLLPLAVIGRPPRGRSRADAIPEFLERIGERAIRELSAEMAKRLTTSAMILGGMYLTKEQSREALLRLPSMIQSSAYAVFEEMGEAKGVRRLILKVATKAFGPPTPEQKAALDAIVDVSRLDRLFDRVDRVKSWDALLRGR